MDAAIQFQNLLQSDAPILALAPMQDVTDLPFNALDQRLHAKIGAILEIALDSGVMVRTNEIAVNCSVNIITM